MACKDYQKLLAPYLEGELASPDQARLELHLSECEPCQEQVESLRLGLVLFKALAEAEPEPEPSPYLAERVAARMMEKKSVQRPLRTRLALAFGTVAFLLVGALAGYWLRPHLPGTGAGQGISLNAIRFQSPGMGVEIQGDNFVLHSRDTKGKKGIDLKF